MPRGTHATYKLQAQINTIPDYKDETGVFLAVTISRGRFITEQYYTRTKHEYINGHGFEKRESRLTSGSFFDNPAVHGFE